MSDPDGAPPTDEAAPDAPSPRRRRWPWAIVRGAVVVAAGAVAYTFVVPLHSAIPSRVERLLPARNGTTDFAGPPAQVTTHPASAAGLTSLSAAAKAHPDQTGVAVAQWSPKGAQSSDGLVEVAFLSPSPATAGKVSAELKQKALAADTYTADGLVRGDQFGAPGVAGAAGAVFSAAPGTPAPGSIAAVVFDVGRVTGYVEVARSTGSPEADAQKAATTEAARLRSTVPGFTLTPTRYPVVATVVWAAGTAVLALLVGAGPLWRQRRRERREAARRAEEERLIRVGGSTIVRTRRGS